MKNVTNDFYVLFAGRADVAFIDAPGQTPRQVKTQYDVHESLYDLVHAHLHQEDQSKSRGAVGVYPLLDGTDCKWICSDFDDERAEEYAVKLCQAWGSYGVTAWAETSKSKGFHVWVFIDDWCSGTIARRAALWVHQIADVPATEVNPKQEITDGYGNCVRLPYWTGRGKGRMQVYPMLESRGIQGLGGDGMSLDNFVRRATETRTSVATLKSLAVKYQPPEARAERGTFDGPAPERGGGYGDTYDWPRCKLIYHEHIDVAAGGRDQDLHALAHYMKGINLELDEAMQVMTEVWNDQVEQPPGDTYPLRTAIEKVRRVYGGIR